jgi:hypothetical protein
MMKMKMKPKNPWTLDLGVARLPLQRTPARGRSDGTLWLDGCLLQVRSNTQQHMLVL